MKHQAFEHN